MQRIKIHRYILICCIAALILCISSCHAKNNTTTHNNNQTTNSNNNTDTDVASDPESGTTPLQTFQVIFCIVVIIVGFTGNFLVILLFTLRCSRLKTCEVLMVSLAVADLIGTFIIPLDMLNDSLGVKKTIGNEFISCLFPTWLGTTCVSVSSITLVAIAIDRFIIVAWPMKIRYSNSIKLYVLVGVTWVIGGLFGVNKFTWMFQTYNKETDSYVCASNPRSHGEIAERAYTVGLFFLQIAIPVCIMTFLYTFIAIKLRSGSVSARRLSETDNVTRIRSRRQKKATKLFITVCTIFYVLVLPSNFFQLFLAFGYVEYTETNMFIYHIVTLLLLTNSCVNPIIYSRLHKNFRKSTVSLLCGCCIPKYRRYKWNSQYIGHSSYMPPRRSTANTQSQYINSTRASPSPSPATGSLTRSKNSSSSRLSSTVSPRSSRIRSTGSDDVFVRKPSLKVDYSKNEDLVKIQLDEIPEQNGVFTETRNGSCGQEKSSAAGKYIRFSNISVDGKLTNGRHTSHESTSTMKSDLGGLTPEDSQCNNVRNDDIGVSKDESAVFTDEKIRDSPDVQL